MIAIVATFTMVKSNLSNIEEHDLGVTYHRDWMPSIQRYGSCGVMPSGHIFIPSWFHIQYSWYSTFSTCMGDTDFYQP